ncbi:hypothetical protein BDV93DRAFT_514900 [Ceratobasidium sp. AG-I]|nr:hypothetical protein BDV93DRAFT_514900 [Ceratobasidium sp. AG-I]
MSNNNNVSVKPEKFRLSAEKNAKVKKGELILRTMSFFEFKKGDDFVLPFYENNTPEFWKDVVIYGWAGSLSDDGSQIYQSGFWDFKYPGSHYEYFKIENIVDMEINPHAAWRGGQVHVFFFLVSTIRATYKIIPPTPISRTEPILWLNTNRFSYAMQKPEPTYATPWAKVVTSWKRHTGLDGTFHQVQPSYPRPNWFNENKQWTHFQRPASSSEESDDEPTSTSKRATGGKRRVPPIKRRPSTAATSASKAKASTSEVRTTPRRPKKKPSYVEIEEEEEEEDYEGEEDEEEEEEEEEEDESEASLESEGGAEGEFGGDHDNSEIEVIEVRGRKTRASGAETRGWRKAAAVKTAAKPGPSTSSKPGGTGAGTSRSGKRVPTRSLSIEYAGKGKASIDPRRDSHLIFGTDSSAAGSDNDAAPDKKTDPPRGLSGDPQSRAPPPIPPVEDAGGAGGKRKAAEDVPGGEELAETERKRLRGLDEEQSDPGEAPVSGPMEGGAIVVTEPKVTGDDRGSIMDPPSVNATSPPAAMDVEPSSKGLEQIPDQARPPSRTSLASASMSESEGTEPRYPFTQVPRSSPIRDEPAPTQDSTASSAFSQPLTGSSQVSVRPSTPEATWPGPSSLPGRSAAAMAAGRAADARMAAVQLIPSRQGPSEAASALLAPNAAIQPVSEDVAAPSTPLPSAARVVAAMDTAEDNVSSVPVEEDRSASLPAAPAAQESASIDVGTGNLLGGGRETAEAQLTDEERRRQLTDTDGLDERGPRG